MSTFEDRLGVALRDLSDDVVPVHLLGRLRPDPPEPRRSGRLPVVVAAAAAAAVIGVASLLAWGRLDGPRVVEPVQHPPKVFRLSGLASDAPGRAVMAVTLTDGQSRRIKPRRTWSAGRMARSGALPAGSRRSPRKRSDSLTGVATSSEEPGRCRPAHVLVACGRPGRADRGRRRRCTSRCRRTAALSRGTPRVTVRLRSSPPGPAGCSGGCPSLPDEVIGTDQPGSSGGDRCGRMVAGRQPVGGSGRGRHPGRRPAGRDAGATGGARLVNGSQSWSPDGRGCWSTSGGAGGFLGRETDGTGATALRAPPRGTAADGLGRVARRVARRLAGRPEPPRLRPRRAGLPDLDAVRRRRRRRRGGDLVLGVRGDGRRLTG